MEIWKKFNSKHHNKLLTSIKFIPTNPKWKATQNTRVTSANFQDAHLYQFNLLDMDFVNEMLLYVHQMHLTNPKYNHLDCIIVEGLDKDTCLWIHNSNPEKVSNKESLRISASIFQRKFAEANEDLMHMILFPFCLILIISIMLFFRYYFK